MAYEFQESTQKGILCLAKTDENFLIQVVPMVKAEYFEFPCHGKIWTAILSYYLKYKVLPNDDQILDTVKPHLEDGEFLSEYRDELSSINQLDVSVNVNPEFYLDKVEDFAKQQAIKEAILESVPLVKNGQYTLIQDKINKALSITRTVDLGTDYLSDFQERKARLASSAITPSFRTPFPRVNQELEGGLCRKEFAMVVAPPGVGKSVYLVNQASRSLLDGHNVLYVSLEMSEDRISQRFDAILTRSSMKEVKADPDMIENKLIHIAQTLESKNQALGKLRIKEFPTKRLTIPALRAYLNQLKNFENFTPDVLVVDYLELMEGDRTMSEYQIQQRLAEELRGIGQEYNLLVWTATQTNRDGRKVKTITDTELADSYGKIRVADLSFSINQLEEEFDKGEARVYIMKSRNGRARYTVQIGVNYSNLVMQEK